MTDIRKLLVLVGSSRQGSFNRQLAEAAKALAERAGAQVQLPDLRDLKLPFMDQDLETAEGIPPAARELRQSLEASDALIVVTPEYNGFPPAILKNAIDWMTRPDGDVAGIDAFRNKPALVLTASPGALGGLRSLTLTRQLLDNLGMLLMPEKLAVSRASEGFAEDGSLSNEHFKRSLETAVKNLLQRLA